MISRVLLKVFCWFGVHTPPPGVCGEYSISFYCEGCRQVVPGSILKRRRR